MILIHAHYGPTTTESVIYLTLLNRWAVPFFFLVSGYFFFFRFRTNPTAAIKKTERSLLSVFLVVNLIYLLVLLLTSQPIGTLATHFTLLKGSYFHLWFVSSLIVGYACLYFLWRAGLQRFFLPIALTLIGLVLLMDTYAPFIGVEVNPVYPRHLLSLPLLLIGFLCAQHRVSQRVSLLLCAALTGLGLIILVAEVALIAQASNGPIENHEVLFGVLLVALGLFLLSLKLTIASHNVLAEWGRKYSLPIYLYHPIVNYGLYLVLDSLDFPGVIYLYFLSPFVTLLLVTSALKFLEKKTPRTYQLLTGAPIWSQSLFKRQL